MPIQSMKLHVRIGIFALVNVIEDKTDSNSVASRQATFLSVKLLPRKAAGESRII
jgi:hypothetical protein